MYTAAVKSTGNLLFEWRQHE